jgi:hypothetical protein
MTSFTVSSPAETRTKPSVMLTLIFRQQIIYCVVMPDINNGSGIKFDNEHSFILSKSLRPASIPPLFQKHVTPAVHLFWAISYCGCDFKNGILLDSHWDAVLKTRQPSRHFHNVYLVESLKSLNF